MDKSSIFDISWTSILRVLFIIALFLLLYYTYDILLILFVVVILTSALSPLVDWLKKKLKINRGLAVGLIFSILLALITVTAYSIIPVVIEQFRALLQTLPDYLGKLSRLSGTINSGEVGGIDSVLKSLGSVGGTFVNSAGVFFGGVATIFYILVLTLFLLLEEDQAQKFLIGLLPIQQKTYVLSVTKKISEKMGRWFIAQIGLMIMIGVVNGAAYWAIGIPYALMLGVLSGLLEIIPIIGPIIAAIPAVLIAYLDNPWKAVFVIIFALAFDQIQNQFIIPKTMQKAVGNTPFVIIIALMIGARLGGMIGAIIAVPVLAILQVISSEWPNIRKRI